YAPSYGLQPLRERWKEEIYQKNPSLMDKEISLPVVTQAITHGLSVVADMWVDPGDLIFLTDKLWGNYNMIFGVRKGARILQFPLFDTSGFFNLKGLEASLEEHKDKAEKLIVLLNFPNNPTGYTPTKSEAQGIVNILLCLAERGKNIVVICDDAYFGLVYEEGVLEESIFAYLTGLHERILAIKLDAATKENYVWGLRVGFLTYGTHVRGDQRQFYEALEKKSAGCVRGSISNASRLSQEIVLRSMGAKSYYEEKRQRYQTMKERALLIKEILKDTKYKENFEAYPFNSGYFMCINVKGVDAERVRLHLLEKYGVGVISLGSNDIRVAFSCVEKEDLRELFDLINNSIMALKAN
ncbi:MAG: aminotransferase class I/II-fold pyridoxal phosphate-dependent enzyme, partial [Desulfatiglandales bacterium]